MTTKKKKRLPRALRDHDVPPGEDYCWACGELQNGAPSNWDETEQAVICLRCSAERKVNSTKESESVSDNV